MLTQTEVMFFFSSRENKNLLFIEDFLKKILLAESHKMDRHLFYTKSINFMTELLLKKRFLKNIKDSRIFLGLLSSLISSLTLRSWETFTCRFFNEWGSW